MARPAASLTRPIQRWCSEPSVAAGVSGIAYWSMNAVHRGLGAEAVEWPQRIVRALYSASVHPPVGSEIRAVQNWRAVSDMSPDWMVGLPTSFMTREMPLFAWVADEKNAQ